MEKALVIEASGLSKAYGKRRVLHGVSFAVAQGEVAGFLGANGAGKTTTMDILCGCRAADTGTVKIAGHDMWKEPLAAKKLLGYLPEVPPLYRDMTVGETLHFAARLRQMPPGESRRAISELTARLGLAEVQGRLVGQLSKGFRQRLALAAAIIHRPPVLILDEPTEGLDPQQIVSMRELIKELASEHTVILSSHILSEVEQICDRLIIIKDGQIVAEGSYASLAAKAQLEQPYHITLARAPQQFLAELANHAGVVAARMHPGQGNTIAFQLTGPDRDGLLEAITRKAVHENFGLRELHCKSTSLEELFVNILTKSGRESHG